MKKFMYKYLDAYYYLKESNVGNGGIYAIDNNSWFETPINGDKLIKEVVNLFGYNYTRTKWLINGWAKAKDKTIDLSFYWMVASGSYIPKSKRIYSKLIGSDLIQVRPLSKPSGELFHMDTQIQSKNPDYLICGVDPAMPDGEVVVFKVMDHQDRILKKWRDSGLLDGLNGGKENIARIFEGQTRQLLK